MTTGTARVTDILKVQLMDIDYLKMKRIESESYYGFDYSVSKKRDFCYLPVCNRKLSAFSKKYDQHIVERLGYLIGIVLAHQGYNGFKQLKAIDLRVLLGKSYAQILDWGEHCNWIQVDRTPCEYHSTSNSKFHRSIRVVGWNGSFNRVKIRERHARMAVLRFRQLRLSDEDEIYRRALIKVYQDSRNSRVIKEGYGEFNRFLASGLHYPNIDPFGRRIHSFITYAVDRKTRSCVKPLGHFKQDVVEVDIKSSHPSLLYELGTNPACLVHAFDEDKVIDAFFEILTRNYFEETMLHQFRDSLEEGRFYETFWKDCLDESFPQWREFGLKKYNHHYNMNHRLGQIGERSILKLLFMLVVNGGAKKCLDAISRSKTYTTLGRLIIVYNHEYRIPWFLENIQDFNKPYWPQKNMCLTLQRIESKALIHVLDELDGTWCLPIHDGILTLEKDMEKTSQAIAQSHRELGLKPPRISIK